MQRNAVSDLIIIHTFVTYLVIKWFFAISGIKNIGQIKILKEE